MRQEFRGNPRTMEEDFNHGDEDGWTQTNQEKIGKDPSKGHVVHVEHFKNEATPDFQEQNSKHESLISCKPSVRI